VFLIISLACCLLGGPKGAITSCLIICPPKLQSENDTEDNTEDKPNRFHFFTLKLWRTNKQTASLLSHLLDHQVNNKPVK
jgi:hypothetical protein